MVKTHYPNPTWSERDRNGHMHRFSGNDLPSLKIIIAGHHWCDECGESHEHNVYACIECGVKVEPRYTTKRPEATKPRAAKRKKTYAEDVVRLLISEVAIEAQRDDLGISSFNSSGTVERIEGPPRYTLIINNGEYQIGLTEIEIQVAAQAAKRGHKGMLDFADTILRDRGIIE